MFMWRNVLSIFLLALFGCSSEKVSNKKDSLKADFIESTEKKVVDGIPQLEIHKFKLKNGLRVLIAPNDKLPIFSFFIHYGVGSKHETKGITGSSHFLEHMMFKGGKVFNGNSFDKHIEGNGGVSNAYTTNDATVYHENLPKAALDITLKIEADRMQNLLLEPEAFLAEKDVVLEERKMRYENSPKGQLYIRTISEMFLGTPYTTPVIGSIEDIKRVTRDEVYQYFKTFYAPNNAVIVIAGDVDILKTVKMIEDNFASIQASENLDKIKRERENESLYSSTLKQSKLEMYYGQSENPLFMMAIDAYPLGTRKSYVLDVLSKTWGEGESSYLEQKYVKSLSPKLVEASSGNYTFMHKGIFVTSGEFYKSMSYVSWQKELKDDLDYFCENEINEKNLHKALNNIEMQYYENLDQNAGVADFIGSMELFYGDFKKYNEELSIYKSITIEELKNECLELSKKPKYLLGIWKNFEKKVKI